MISNSILAKQRVGKIIFDILLNTIGYSLIFALFSWDKIYYIIKKRGNDNSVYFKLKYKDSLYISRENYIGIYKKCSIPKFFGKRTFF